MWPQGLALCAVVSCSSAIPVTGKTLPWGSALYQALLALALSSLYVLGGE